MCDACKKVWYCSVYSGSAYTWGRSDWPCKCIGDSGDLLLYDTDTRTGDPDCTYNE